MNWPTDFVELHKIKVILTNIILFSKIQVRRVTKHVGVELFRFNIVNIMFADVQGPIPETIRSLGKSDGINNFSSAHDFAINRISRTIDHDPGDPARYVDRCWIRNFITTIDHFISDITIVKIHKLPGNIY